MKMGDRCGTQYQWLGHCHSQEVAYAVAVWPFQWVWILLVLEAPNVTVPLLYWYLLLYTCRDFKFFVAGLLAPSSL